jgi:DNA-directed RNA polymerase sigma subunit (sigma70/sigma32)
MIAEELNVDKETVRQILTENLKTKQSACQDGSKEFK